MGRHSRKESVQAPGPGHPQPAERAGAPAAAPAPAGWAEPAAPRRYAAPPRHEPVPGARGGHPEQREPGGAWGAAAGTGAAYGDWRGAPRTRPASDTPAYDTSTRDIPTYDTPAFGTPAVGFPQVTLDPPMSATGSHRRVPVPVAEDAFTATGSHRRVTPPEDPFTATGSHRRIPAPRTPVTPVTPVAPAEEAPPAAAGRGVKGRTYAGMAAAAVTVVLAVVVAGQAASEDDSGKKTARAADEGNRHTTQGDSAASRSDGRPTPDVSAAIKAAPELSYDEKMAQQFPIDEKLKGPGTFDTVPGVATAPGKGRVVRYRVDVEQGLDLDPQLFAEAVHRTLNDDRSWGHGGTKTFERVPGGEAEFVITLASPGTTGVWCRKSGLDTTIDNVSCDSASTDRVMINAYRWSQGSATYGADQMFAYRQMLINHEVGHRLGHGHVSCRTPGSLAPIMQQQTKSLDVNGIQCKPNPWVYPGS